MDVGVDLVEQEFGTGSRDSRGDAAEDASEDRTFSVCVLFAGPLCTTPDVALVSV